MPDAMTAPVPQSIPSRLVRMFRADEPLCCPMGHKLAQTAGILQHTWLVCTRASPDGRGGSRRCGEFLYVRRFAHGVLGTVRVEWREALHMAKLNMTVADAAAFLQVPWPEVSP